MYFNMICRIQRSPAPPGDGDPLFRLTVERAAARLVETVAPVLAKDARAFGLQRAS
jgi:hypothetical protein